MNMSTLKITPEFLNQIALIDEFKGSWRTLGLLAPERLQSLKHVATVESIGSSTRIEGSKLSDREVEAILSNLEVESFDTRDEQEVAGYANVMDIIFESWEDIPLSENHIKQLHKELLRFSEKDQHHRGKYKTLSNSVSAFDQDGKEIGVIFETSSPFDTPIHMQELIAWANQTLEAKALHPLLVTALFIVTFLEIHPFQDGNGRLSRALTTILLLKSGYHYVPYASMESIIEENKENYYLSLRQTQPSIRTESPDWQPWVSFFLKCLKKQIEKLSIKLEREKILLTTLPELSLHILDHLKIHGRVTMAEMVKLTGVNRNTLKEHFRNLLKSKRIQLHGKGRGSWYSL